MSRAEKQRDILAPGHVGRLEEAQALAPEAHELRELLGLARAKRDPAIHVDAAQHEAGVHAVVDVPLIDVVIELGSISCVATFSRSGSIVGAQATMPWNAEVRELQ